MWYSVTKLAEQEPTLYIDKVVRIKLWRMTCQSASQPAGFVLIYYSPIKEGKTFIIKSARNDDGNVRPPVKEHGWFEKLGVFSYTKFLFTWEPSRMSLLDQFSGTEVVRRVEGRGSVMEMNSSRSWVTVAGELGWVPFFQVPDVDEVKLFLTQAHFRLVVN